MRDWTFVFDLDGTLVDTAPDLAAATNHVMRHLDLAPVSEAEIRPFVGYGALVMIEKTAASHGRTLAPHELPGLFKIFIDHYKSNISAHSKPYDGMIRALQGLAEQGAILAVCTNKMQAHAQLLLDELKMSPLFSAITGRDRFAVCKPDPAHLTGTIALARGDVSKSVMIGDSETDILTAKAAGVLVVAVDFGYSAEPVATFKPDAIISHFDELAAVLDKLGRCKV